ncbi:MAG TPA: SulP family inorganic anion transporter [Actinomycetota bacterium]|nr:SulP family inorganic anion transporter [Actinomycetota bacterium]
MSTEDRTDQPLGSRLVPGLSVLRSYERAWLRYDLIAGLVLAAFLVPVGMGYAEASGLPAITGLYATIVPLLAYAILGPSRILVLGPDSSLAPIIAVTVVALAAGDPEQALALAGMTALMTGALLVLAGLFRLGYLTDLLSLPIRFGYLNGIALTVIVSQLPKVFGFSTDAEGLLDEASAFLRGVADGETVVAALAIGLASIVVVVAGKRLAPVVPWVLVAVVGGSLAVTIFGLHGDVEVVGALPRGLPSFDLPSVPADDLPRLAAAAVSIALVAFADTSVLSRTYAARLGDDVDPNREMIALGAANLATGLFQGFPISSSSSRTPVAESAGSKTQLTGVVGAAAITLMLLFAPAALRNLPQATLGAIVIVAATSLVEIPKVRRLFRVRPSEFWVSIACFLGVALLGVIPGIFLAIGIGVAQFVHRAWIPYDAVLGRVKGLKGYHDVTRHPEGLRIPGLILYRWDAPLFFANAARFRERVFRHVRRAGPDVKWVVVAGEPITDVDATAARALSDLLDDLDARSVRFAFAELKGPVWDQLVTYGLAARIGERYRFPTLGTAVKAYVEETGTPWVDPNPD